MNEESNRNAPPRETHEVSPTSSSNRVDSWQILREANERVRKIEEKHSKPLTGIWKWLRTSTG